VTGKDEEAAKLLVKLDNLSYTLSSHRELVGTYMGVLIGAAMMGATRDKLKTIGQGIYNHYRWDTA